MDLAGEVRKGEELDWKNLRAYLHDINDHFDGEFTVSQFHGGHANLTYLLTFKENSFVLRRPPFGKLAVGSHSMKREYKMLHALMGKYSRAPKVFHYCSDESIIGSEFVIMERKSGVVVRRNIPDSLSVLPNVHDRISQALVDALGDLHLIPVSEEMLTLGKPSGFLDRQLQGWTNRWHDAKVSENQQMDEILNQLALTIPTSKEVTVIHNDFKLDNCQFQPNNPDKITAVFDWDMSTIGDPLFDLGTSLSYWPDESFNDLNLPFLLKGPFPSKDFIKEQYHLKTGFDLSSITWYEVLTTCKLATIAQQLYKRYHDGATKDQRMKIMGQVADAMITKVALIVKRL